MTANRNNHPLDPMEDQVLDQYLASLGRYAPSPAFGDRVMARVRITAPLPAPAPSFAAPAVRRRGWPGLGDSLSGGGGRAGGAPGRAQPAPPRMGAPHPSAPGGVGRRGPDRGGGSFLAGRSCVDYHNPPFGRVRAGDRRPDRRADALGFGFF